MAIHCGGFIFTADFDSGNLAKVELVSKASDVSGSGSDGNAGIDGIDHEFNVWPQADCAGTEFENGNRTWFHFGLKGGSALKVMKLNIVNLNRQVKMFSQGMAPVFRNQSTCNQWERIREKPTFSYDGSVFTLSFKHKLLDTKSFTYFAFTYPYSYSELQAYLLNIDNKFVQNKKQQQNADDIYYQRECVCYTLEGRRVDLLTISSHHDITDTPEPRIPHLFPEVLSCRPKKFFDKKVIFLSARVHPGETPSSFVMQGFINFLLTPDDPIAQLLRKMYVFKIMPMLNPDGVARGYYRTDTRGVNLNRYYSNPSHVHHPSVFAARSLILYYHYGSEEIFESLLPEIETKVSDLVLDQSPGTNTTDCQEGSSSSKEVSALPSLVIPVPRPDTPPVLAKAPEKSGLFLYMDFHGHASKKGIFMYGNHFKNTADKVECMLLAKIMSINSPHFHFHACNFTERIMYLRDRRDGLSREGAGRVAVGKITGLVRSYTLECNYNTGRIVNVVPSSSRDPVQRSNLNLVPPKYTPALFEEDGPAKVTALAWAPNNVKLAVCSAEQIIYLFDDKGERKDKFPTKPADSGNGRKSYVVKALAFSPDSTKLAVAQSDSIIFIYKLGDDWGDKKVICNKFIQQCPVLSMVWLADGPIVYGQSDGKVRLAHVKSNKTQTLYASNSFVVALCLNVRGTGVLSGHSDGSIIRYYVSEDAYNLEKQQGRVVQHPVAPYALSWPAGYILAAGCDRIVTLYESDGRVHRTFDYTAPHYKEREFTVACSSPSGQAVCVGSYDNIKLFAWSPSKSIWEEQPNKVIPNWYTVSALSWKRDGSRIACAGLCGSVEIFESVLKRTIWRGKFEMIYVSPSQVLVKPLSAESRGRGVILKSQYGYEITDVAIMGNDRYLVARTPDTILLGDLHRNLLSEVLWPDSGRNEKFYFDNVTVCLVFNAGELSIIEYGNNEIITSVRTEFMNPHLISVRLNERKQVHSTQENKKLAYLLDLHTICVIDLLTNLPTLHINHDSKIDWLELNETAHKLLYRDKKMRLTLLDIRTSEKHNILNYCTFVQWLPGSDVVVAQSRHNACVWYNIDTPDRITQFSVRGDMIDVIRENGQSEILTQDGNHQLGYELDESLIEFGTAVHDSDFGKAILYLESLGINKKESEGMWQNLAEVAIQLHNLHVAEICYAALGNISTTHFLRETINVGEAWSKENSIGDLLQCPELWARMAILNKQFKVAEEIYLENNKIQKAIDMFLKLYKWEDALYLAETNNYEYNDLKNKYMKWLTDTRQEDKAGELCEKQGDYQTALKYYLKANFTFKACKIVQSETYLLDNHDVFSQIVKGLIKNERYIQAGQIYEIKNDSEKALECYRKGKVYDKCIDLTRKINPQNVTAFEEEWGDHLIENKQYSAAINHYIEAGKNKKALDTSIKAEQWKKAVQIYQVITNKEEIGEHVNTLAQHFITVKDYRTAEKIYLNCDMHQRIIEMYNQTGQWEKAYAIAEKHLDLAEIKSTFIQKCKQLEEEGKFNEAQRLYIIIDEPDLAISMFKNQKQYENMLRLVRNHHPNLVDTTLLHLAQECEESKNYKQAEKYYIECNEWKLAIKMYRSLNLWEDAYRIALHNGGQEAVEPVVYLWAKSLGGDSAVRLLNRFSLLESCISNACDTYQFDFAFELARIGMKSKLEEVHYKYALILEDNGQFSEAEKQFIKANKPKEAISMYNHNQDWENAERIANEHDPSSLADILMNQSKNEFENGNFSTFETLLLRAHKVDLIIEKYKMNHMWNEALRVCGEYVPSKLPLLQQEYETEINTNISKDSHSLITQARQWEQNGEFYNAVECYLKIKNVDGNLMVKMLNEVTQLTLKYLNHDQCYKIISTLIPQLMEYKQYDLAVRVYLNIDMIKEAVDIFIYTQNWNKARKLCAELKPEYQSYVENQYKEWLKVNGDADMLSEIDINTALDILMNQGQWTECLEKAQNMNNNLLHKYLALFAMHLIKNKEYAQLTEVLNRYGTPNIPQFYKIYKQIAYCILNNPNESVNLIISLRNLLFRILKNQCNDEDIEILMFISHLMLMKVLLMEIPSEIDLLTNICISLLRYTDVITSDKAYYDAGYYCQQTNRDSEAFIFWNHYLDICDAIEDNNTDNLEHTDLIHTDFPQDITLPTRPSINPDRHEQVKNWVLAVSVDRNKNASQGLPTDNRKVYIGSLCSLNEQTTETCTPCIISGWPIVNPETFSAKFNVIQFTNKKYANKENYKKVMNLPKHHSNYLTQNIVDFINEWCIPVN